MKLFIGTCKNQFSFNGLMVTLVLYQIHWTRRTELLAYSRQSCWHTAGAAVGIWQAQLLSYGRHSCWRTAGAAVGTLQAQLLAHCSCSCWHMAGAAVGIQQVQLFPSNIKFGFARSELQRKVTNIIVLHF